MGSKGAQNGVQSGTKLAETITKTVKARKSPAEHCFNVSVLSLVFITPVFDLSRNPQSVEMLFEQGG